MSYKQYRNDKAASPERKPLLHDGTTNEEDHGVTIAPEAKSEADRFSRMFLVVYSLVMASDWLQGKTSVTLNILCLPTIQAHMYTVYIKTNSD